MAELVEEGGRVLPADQQRLAGRPLHEVRVVGHDRRDHSVKAFLRAVLVHPRARLLVLAGVRIEVPEPDVLALAVLDLEHADIGMGDRYGAGGNRREVEVEQLPGDPEHPFAQLLELQVRFHLVGVEVVLGGADLLGVEAVVPRLDLDFRRAVRGALLVGDRLHVGDLLVDSRDRRRPDRLHQPHRVLGRLRHRVLEAPVGMRRVAEQLGPRRTQLQDLRDQLVVVVRVAVVAATHERAPGLLAQVAAGRVLEEGLDARARVEHGAPGLDAAGAGACNEAAADRFGQPREIRVRVEREPVVVLVGEQVLRELRVQARELLVELREARLGGRIELGAREREVRVVEPAQALLLGVEAALLARGVDGGDAPEQLVVLDDPVGVRRELRRHFLVDGLQALLVQRRDVDLVDALHAVQHAAGALHRDDRVLEGRRCGVVRDLRDIGELGLHTGKERRLEVGDPDLVEGRYAAVRTRPGRKHRASGGIRSGGCKGQGEHGHGKSSSGSGEDSAHRDAPPSGSSAASYSHEQTPDQPAL